MGPEAVIVQSRQALEESGHLGEYEVVVGQAPAPADAAPPPLSPAPAPEGERLSDELAELRRQMEMMRRTITRNMVAGPRWAEAPPQLSEAYSALVAAEVEAELARDIVDAVAGRMEAHPGEPPLGALAAEMTRRLRVNPLLGRPGAGRRIAALVGPPGAGKTTTLVKLAVACGLTGRRPVQLLSMDNYRVGGGEQLRSFAAILGVGFQAVETVGALAQAIEEYRNKELILIDTPGYGAREMDGAGDVARYLIGRPDIDTHLVLTASMKPADVVRVAERFEIFRPANLLFTRLDETATLGTPYTLAVQTGKPLSFLGTGQQIPEDLEPADAVRIVGFLLDPVRRASRAA